MLKKFSLFLLLTSLVVFLFNFFFFDFSSLSADKSFSDGEKIMALDIPINVASKSVLLVNLDTDSVIFEKNTEEKLPIASLTKIITALVVLDKVKDLETKVSVKKEVVNSLYGTESSLSGIKIGEELSVLQLLHCLLIPSGNDAALVLSDYVGEGSIEKFVEMMNEKVAQLGCKNTHFMNPHGLDEEGHFSTAKDLATIAKYAMGNSLFMEISSTSTSKILGEGRYPLVTTNSTIDRARGRKYFYKYAKGIKTGYSSKAGRCLVSMASNEKYSYLRVALGGFGEKDENVAMIDSKNLYQWAFDNLQLRSLATKNVPLGETNLKLSWGSKKLPLSPFKDCSVMLPKDILPSSIEYRLDVPERIFAPIKEGQVLGKATLSYANSPVAVVDLVCEKAVKRSFLLLILYIFTSFLHSIWFRASLAILLVLLAFYVILVIRQNKFRKRRRNKGGYLHKRNRNIF